MRNSCLVSTERSSRGGGDNAVRHSVGEIRREASAGRSQSDLVHIISGVVCLLYFHRCNAMRLRFAFQMAVFVIYNGCLLTGWLQDGLQVLCHWEHGV